LIILIILGTIKLRRMRRAEHVAELKTYRILVNMYPHIPVTSHGGLYGCEMLRIQIA
jgi:hypothetical protein